MNRKNVGLHCHAYSSSALIHMNQSFFGSTTGIAKNSEKELPSTPSVSKYKMF
jgi:hypothetical protein